MNETMIPTIVSKYKIVINPKKCVGCRSCEAFCSLFNEKVVNPALSRIRVKEFTYECRYEPVVCRQCSAPICVFSCPVEGAMVRDAETGAIIIKDEKCIGCQNCVNACPYDSIWYNKRNDKIIKCDLCGGESKCVNYCEPGAISLIRMGV